jgi:SpoVK/Ycf46/Vps4 family AAA+-type ATPase
LNEALPIITETCVLPNGLATVKQAVNPECVKRAVLLYGPTGSGKSMLINAVVDTLGAMCIDISPSNLEGKFEEKDGPTRLMHMVFTVATDPAFAPVVVKVEDCDNVFVKKGKRKDTAAAQPKGAGKRFQKDLLIYKNRMIQPHHQVMVIGTTNCPPNCDTKILKWKGSKGKPEKQGFFESFVFLPPPSAQDRRLFWNIFFNPSPIPLQSSMQKDDNCIGPGQYPELNYHAFVQSSENATAGDIELACSKCIATPPSLEQKLLKTLTEVSVEKCDRKTIDDASKETKVIWLLRQFLQKSLGSKDEARGLDIPSHREDSLAAYLNFATALAVQKQTAPPLDAKEPATKKKK